MCFSLPSLTQELLFIFLRDGSMLIGKQDNQKVSCRKENRELMIPYKLIAWLPHTFSLSVCCDACNSHH